MCGIAGVMRLREAGDRPPLDGSEARAMAGRLRHRGPDEEVVGAAVDVLAHSGASAWWGEGKRKFPPGFVRLVDDQLSRRIESSSGGGS